MDWASQRPINCWILNSFSDAQLHRLPASEVTLHKHTGTGELSPPQMLAVRVVTWAIDESDLCVITAAVAHLGFPGAWTRLPPSFLPLCLSSSFMHWERIWKQKPTGIYRTSRSLASSISVPVYSVTSHCFNRSATNSRSTVRLTWRKYFDWRCRV